MSGLAENHKFYTSLGFVKSGSAYDEDGIMHMPMILAPAAIA